MPEGLEQRAHLGEQQTNLKVSPRSWRMGCTEAIVGLDAGE